jgi:hypothetical protein
MVAERTKLAPPDNFGIFNNFPGAVEKKLVACRYGGKRETNNQAEEPTVAHQ